MITNLAINDVAKKKPMWPIIDRPELAPSAPFCPVFVSFGDKPNDVIQINSVPK